MKRPLRKLACSAMLLLPALGACSGGGEDAAEAIAADTLTRRQRDSVISTLPLPGARVVGAALRATDSARVRADAHDSLLASPR